MADRTDAEETRTGNRTARVLRRVRDADPGRLGFLGVLSIPGYLVDSLAFMQWFVLFCLFFLWVWIVPLVDVALKRLGDADAEPTDWIHMGDWREWAVAYSMIPVTFLNPLAITQDILQFLGSIATFLRYGGSVPAAADERVTVSPPVKGTWTVVNGSLEKEHSHSWFPINQRYAYDFVVTDEDGRSRPAGASARVENYYCYDEPVFAPADGVVVDALDTDFEPTRGGGFSHPLKRDIRGNYVTIQHGPDEYSCLAHLVPGSITVEPGERVERGQEVGRCGHSGNSSEPHLHFQVQDTPVFEVAASLPVTFEAVSTESPWRADERPSRDRDEDVSSEREEDATHKREEDATYERNGEPVEITAGQRLTARRPDPSRETAGTATPIGRRRMAATLERFALGGVIGSVLAFVAGLFVGPLETAAVLAVAAVIGCGAWLIARGGDWVTRPGGPGTPLGLALVAVTWGSVPAARSPLTLALASIALYLAASEYDRYSTRQRFERDTDRAFARREAAEREPT